MSDTSLEEIEAELERARELEDEAAVEVLREARADLARLDGVDDERRADLGHRLEQRLREVSEREAYDGGLGAAMNPEEDDAP